MELPNQVRSRCLIRLPRRALFGVDQDLAVRLLGGYSQLVLAEELRMPRAPDQGVSSRTELVESSDSA